MLMASRQWLCPQPRRFASYSSGSTGRRRSVHRRQRQVSGRFYQKPHRPVRCRWRRRFAFRVSRRKPMHPCGWFSHCASTEIDRQWNASGLQVVEIAVRPHLTQVHRKIGRSHLFFHYALQGSVSAGGMKNKRFLPFVERTEKREFLEYGPSGNGIRRCELRWVCPGDSFLSCCPSERKPVPQSKI